MKSIPHLCEIAQVLGNGFVYLTTSQILYTIRLKENHLPAIQIPLQTNLHSEFIEPKDGSRGIEFRSTMFPLCVNK